MNTIKIKKLIMSKNVIKVNVVVLEFDYALYTFYKNISQKSFLNFSIVLVRGIKHVLSVISVLEVGGRDNRYPCPYVLVLLVSAIALLYDVHLSSARLHHYPHYLTLLMSDLDYLS